MSAHGQDTGLLLRNYMRDAGVCEEPESEAHVLQTSNEPERD